MKTYPICIIDLENQRTVVFGGGRIAERKVEGLRQAGAKPTVISPTVTPRLEALATGSIDLIARPYREGDLAGVFLAVAATDNPEVNQAIWQEARQSGCLINVVDDPDHSNFILPAVVRRDELTVAISTGGASPALAHLLRERLESSFGEEYGEFASLLAEMRPALIRMVPDSERRLQVIARLLDSEVLTILKQEGREPAKVYMLSFFDAALD